MGKIVSDFKQITVFSNCLLVRITFNNRGSTVFVLLLFLPPKLKLFEAMLRMKITSKRGKKKKKTPTASRLGISKII